MSPFDQSFSSQHTKTGNAYWLNVSTFALLILLSIIYIVQVNGSTSKGYQIREWETQIKELTLANQTLELNSQRVQSLDHVAKSVKMLGLVDAGRPEYIRAAEPTYAMAQ